jgi:hypothetical protein
MSLALRRICSQERKVSTNAALFVSRNMIRPSTTIAASAYPRVRWAFSRARAAMWRAPTMSPLDSSRRARNERTTAWIPGIASRLASAARTMTAIVAPVRQPLGVSSPRTDSSG